MEWLRYIRHHRHHQVKGSVTAVVNKLGSQARLTSKLGLLILRLLYRGLVAQAVGLGEPLSNPALWQLMMSFTDSIDFRPTSSASAIGSPAPTWEPAVQEGVRQSLHESHCDVQDHKRTCQRESECGINRAQLSQLQRAHSQASGPPTRHRLTSALFLPFGNPTGPQCRWMPHQLHPYHHSDLLWRGGQKAASFSWPPSRPGTFIQF